MTNLPTAQALRPGFAWLEDDDRRVNPLLLLMPLGVSVETGSAELHRSFREGAVRHPTAGPVASGADGTGLSGGRYVVGPSPATPCLLAVIAILEQHELVALHPLVEPGVRVEGRFEDAVVLEPGVEAWVTLEMGGSIVTFYDTRFALHRATYTPGATGTWRLAAIATDAGPGGDDDTRAVKVPATVTDVLGNTVDLTKASYLLPTRYGPDDQAELRGTIAALREVTFLDAPCWQLDVVARLSLDAPCLELPVLVGRPAWKGRTAPRVGGICEANVRLQGYRDDLPFTTVTGA